MTLEPVPDKDELRRRAPLSVVAAEVGVRVDSSGRAVCPFHDDHDPSFSLFVDQAGVQRWGCFPCGVSGDCFDLVQRVEGVSFGEAFRKVLLITRESPDAPPPPSTSVELDRNALHAYVDSAMERAHTVGCRGYVCIAAGFMTFENTHEEREEYDSHLRDLGWGVDEHGNVVMPHWNPTYTLTGAKVRAVGGRKWSFPGSRYEWLYGDWLSKPASQNDHLVVEGETDFAYASQEVPLVSVLGLPSGAGYARDAWYARLTIADRVYLGFDGDAAGDEATTRWVAELTDRGVQDVYKLLVPRGLDLRSCGIPVQYLINDRFLVS